MTELAIARADGTYPKLLASLAKTDVLVIDLCEAPSYVEFVPPIGDRRATLTIGTQHN